MIFAVILSFCGLFALIMLFVEVINVRKERDT